MRAAARFAPSLETLAGLLGEPKRVSTAKATKVLGWQARPAADTVADTGKPAEAAGGEGLITQRERPRLYGNQRRVACRHGRSR
jgi:hypothetical protein